MNIITILLGVLIAAGVWALVELAVTVRRARPAVDSVQKTVEELNATVTDVAAQVKPVIAHVDEVVTNAQPAVSTASPLLEQTTQAVGTLNADLERIEQILTDVTKVSGAASSATTAVQSATSSIAGRVLGRLGKGRAASEGDRNRRLQTPDAEVVAPVGAERGEGAPAGDDGVDDDEVQVEVERPNVVTKDAGYFTYPTEADDAPAETHEASARP